LLLNTDKAKRRKEEKDNIKAKKKKSEGPKV
jgi:hypothetical protein